MICEMKQKKLMAGAKIISLSTNTFTDHIDALLEVHLYLSFTFLSLIFFAGINDQTTSFKQLRNF